MKTLSASQQQRVEAAVGTGTHDIFVRDILHEPVPALPGLDANGRARCIESHVSDSDIGHIRCRTIISQASDGGTVTCSKVAILHQDVVASNCHLNRSQVPM